MRRYIIEFCDRETMPDRIEALASELDITPEQLIKRCINRYMSAFDPNQGPSVPGEDLDDFMVKNGVLKPRKTPKG